MVKTEAFEKNVDRYEQWFHEHSLAYVSELKAVQALLPKSGEGLEVGVGTGRFAAPLKIMHGVEPAAAMAAFARRRGVEVTEGTAEKLPFGDGRFDYVLMVTLLCFLDDPAAALKEARRVLKPGGVLLVGLIDRDRPVADGLHEKEGKEPLLAGSDLFIGGRGRRPHGGGGISRLRLCPDPLSASGEAGGGRAGKRGARRGVVRSGAGEEVGERFRAGLSEELSRHQKERQCRHRDPRPEVV